MNSQAEELEWQSVEPESGSTLTATRVALHWAAQLPAAAGATLVAARDDYSHTTLTWHRGPNALLTETLPTGQRAGIRPRDLALIVLQADGAIGSTYPLAGRTLEMGLTWLATHLGTTNLERPPHHLPSHGVERGEPFPEPDPRASAQLETWFSNADLVLRSTTEAEEWSEVRVWPHHFDIASLKDLGGGQSVGAGLSPGDGSYDQPYFYVTPWPPPDDAPTSTLQEGGAWHTDGWTGAVLVANNVENAGQEDQVRGFLKSAVDAATQLLS